MKQLSYILFYNSIFISNYQSIIAFRISLSAKLHCAIRDTNNLIRDSNLIVCEKAFTTPNAFNEL